MTKNELINMIIKESDKIVASPDYNGGIIASVNLGKEFPSVIKMFKDEGMEITRIGKDIVAKFK